MNTKSYKKTKIFESYTTNRKRNLKFLFIVFIPEKKEKLIFKIMSISWKLLLKKIPFDGNRQTD